MHRGPFVLIDTLIQRSLLLTSQLLAQLVASGDVVSAATVHDMRVATKRLRAAWQLLTTAAPLAARDARRRLREVHKELAATRRLHVLQGIAQDFMQRKLDDDDRAAIVAIVAGLPTIELSCAEVANLRSCFRRESAAWRELNIEVDDDVLVKAVVTTYRSARRACARVAQHPGIAEHHHWRRRVKRLLFQLEHLGAAPAEFDGRMRHMCELAEELGRLQDYGDLAAHVAGADVAPRAKRRIKRLVDARMQRCRRRARSSGKHAFDRTARKFAARVAAATASIPVVAVDEVAQAAEN